AVAHPRVARVPATRRTYHDEQFTVLDREVEGVNGDGPVVENLRDAVVLDLSQVSPSAVSRNPSSLMKPVTQNWWRDDVLYQIFPRSLAGGNEDGIRHLPGLTEKLDYLEWLGVEGIWLNSIHPSPNVDWGYDASECSGAPPDLR